jgi:hypothetical protein
LNNKKEQDRVFCVFPFDKFMKAFEALNRLKYRHQIIGLMGCRHLTVLELCVCHLRFHLSIGLSSTLIASTDKRPANSRAIISRDGISVRQGGHHVAQKWTRTYWPSAVAETSESVVSVGRALSSKSGAAPRLLGFPRNREGNCEAADK